MKIHIPLFLGKNKPFWYILSFMCLLGLLLTGCESSIELSEADLRLSEESSATARKGSKFMQPGANRVTFQSEGATIIGTLFLPSSYRQGQKLPAIIIDGPWTQVKEQVGYRYGKKLAEEGFAALAIDHRNWGESEGSPRYYESTSQKAKDLVNAISFLEKAHAVDKSRIGLLGVCAGAGITALVVAQDGRVKSFATIAAWLQHPSTTPLFYEGEEGVQRRIALSKIAKEKYEQTGIVDYVAAYDPTPNSGAAMFFPIDYYSNQSRGAIPQWENQFAVMGWQEWLELNAIDGVAGKITVPTLMIHSDGSALPENVRRFYDLLNGPKKLLWTEGEHTQFYDLDPYVSSSARSVADHFKGSLN